MKYLMGSTLLICSLFCYNKAQANASEIIEWIDSNDNTLMTADLQYSLLNLLTSDPEENLDSVFEMDLFVDEGSVDASRVSLFSALDQNLFDQNRASTVMALGLNWRMNNNWKAHAKLQTVSDSVWLPQVNVPRFITQDSENWTLAAVEVVYTF